MELGLFVLEKLDLVGLVNIWLVLGFEGVCCEGVVVGGLVVVRVGVFMIGVKVVLGVSIVMVIVLI